MRTTPLVAALVLALTLLPARGGTADGGATSRRPGTPLHDRVFLSAWSEGVSPDLTLMGRFVEVP